jgi:hypothetical protein
MFVGKWKYVWKMKRRQRSIKEESTSIVRAADVPFMRMSMPLEISLMFKRKNPVPFLGRMPEYQAF